MHLIYNFSSEICFVIEFIRRFPGLDGDKSDALSRNQPLTALIFLTTIIDLLPLKQAS